MAQAILPFLAPGTSPITPVLSVSCEGDIWYYFLGGHPIFSHGAHDRKQFRFITSQLIDSSTCRQIDIIKTFGVSKNSVIRSVNKLRNEGAEAFFAKRQGRRGGKIFSDEMLEKTQALLDQGQTRKDIAEELDIPYDTLRKAINDGRLIERVSAKTEATSKSTRSENDTQAAEAIGTACTRVTDRVAAALGICDGAITEFESCLDVPNGGVLCALPALLSNGLLQDADKFLGTVHGYYKLFHVLLLLAFMALCRIKTVERLRGYAPGEFGKLLGLDRIPEVRCLRQKMDDLCHDDAAARWAAHLSQQWMEADPGAVGTLYIDGHVRVYHGEATKLPRRYVSRERLCLRGITDYWVNDAIGRPFFVIEKVIDSGLLQVLENTIVPRLLEDVPNQPSEQDLLEQPYLSRFILVFDREGYSPAFFAKMWHNHRIACMTYHKHPEGAWPIEWFSEQEVSMPNGERVSMMLAEMGSLVGSGKDATWMREIRRLTDSGHQTSLISTAYDVEPIGLAARMFSRWCQENFFRYMMQHFAIDLLCEQGTEAFPGTEKVVNPAWRALDRQRNSIQNKLRYRNARFAQLTIHTESEDNQAKYQKWLRKKSELLEEIEQFEHELTQIKFKIKETPKHISWEDLKEEDKFYRLVTDRKRLMDTIRMIAYRAETAMAHQLIDAQTDLAAARRILQDLYVTEADILPDKENNQLLIQVHGASRPAVNRKLQALLISLNNADIYYPGTALRVRYELLAIGEGRPSNS